MTARPAATGRDWPSYNRTLHSQRFVPLAAVDRENVVGPRPVCTYDLGIDTSFQTGPIVIGSTLFARTEKETFAIDASTCAEKWRVAETVADSYLRVNRGAAHLDGRLFRGLQDGRVVAHDAATGRKLWETRIADPAKGESVPAAPIAWGGLVFIGQAGGDNRGVKGRMHALDAASGKQVWETDLVPREENRDRPGTAMAAMAAKAWRDPPHVPITGGATWTSYTLDPASGLLYVPGGNPAPDFVSAMRPGENLFANAVVVLDAKSGAYRRHFSLVPEDFHDWDVSSAPTAITTRENVDTPLTREGTRFCPGTQGGSEWNGPAYAPPTNLLYTGTVDWRATPSSEPTGVDSPRARFARFACFDCRARTSGWSSRTRSRTSPSRAAPGVSGAAVRTSVSPARAASRSRRPRSWCSRSPCASPASSSMRGSSSPRPIPPSSVAASRRPRVSS